MNYPVEIYSEILIWSSYDTSISILSTCKNLYSMNNNQLWETIFINLYGHNNINKYRKLFDTNSFRGLHMKCSKIWEIIKTFGMRHSIYDVYTANRFNIIEMNIHCIPKEINTLDELSYLSITHSNISKIPNELCNMRLLSLKLSNSKIKEIPGFISRLCMIQILNLCRNDISEVPIELCNLKTLKKLLLDDNKITIIPNYISNLASLKVLSLDSNNIKYIPKEISKLSNLKLLNLNNNMIDNIPNELLGTFTDFLSIKNNPIKI